MKRAAAAVCGAIVATFAPRAGAVEQENHLGVDVGPSLLVVGGKGSDPGGGILLHWAYGLSDAFNLMVEGSWSVQTFNAHPAFVTDGAAGVGYVFDVLTWVPYAGLLVGGYEFTGSAIGGPKFLPGAVLAFGLDYRINRRVAVGLAVRENMFLTEPAAYPSFIQIFARAEATWGW